MGGGMAASYSGEDRSTDFSHSKLFAMDVEEVDHDPELEEAAIRFANGDDAAAEAALLDALGPNGTRALHEQTWLTLFDFYRAVGAHDSFENKALDFADRFGRSAPPWFSMPEQIAKLKPVSAPTTAAATNATWSSPSVVSGQTIVALKTAIGKAQQPWHIDWGRLQNLEPTALEPLTALLRQWAGSPVQLAFSGAKQLEDVLAKLSPSGDRSVDPAVWRTRMEALRVMHRADDFELVALDYCVTYEVSPPSWDAVQCNFKSNSGSGSSAEGHSTIIGDAYKDSMHTGASSLFGESSQQGGSQFHTLGQVELSGKIEGDATAALEKIEHKLQGADLLVISCAKLVRVDFGAAGSLLNWVTARQSEGRMVQFNDVHRLVAAFFNVVGVSEHARVVTRVD
jgi:ABC-type transporter Mla MlaB component